jgi:hypothetical protein
MDEPVTNPFTQFSLRKLLVMVTSCAVAFAILANPPTVGLAVFAFTVLVSWVGVVVIGLGCLIDHRWPIIGSLILVFGGSILMIALGFVFLGIITIAVVLE